MEGVLAYPDLERLPLTLELGVICTPQATIAGQIAALARKGTKAAVVITAGLGELRQAMLDAARPNLTQILGPNCLGLIAPGLTLNASFAHIAPLPGNVAFVRNPARWRPRC